MQTLDIGLKHQLITKTVIGCAFEVINELGAGISRVGL